LPCHYAVVFWWVGAVAVRFSFATFFILFWVHFSNMLFYQNQNDFDRQRLPLKAKGK